MSTLGTSQYFFLESTPTYSTYMFDKYRLLESTLRKWLTVPCRRVHSQQFSHLYSFLESTISNLLTNTVSKDQFSGGLLVTGVGGTRLAS
jgi:hypothetical protein